MTGDKDEPLKVVLFSELDRLIPNYQEARVEEESGAGCLGIWRTPYTRRTRLTWGPGPCLAFGNP